MLSQAAQAAQAAQAGALAARPASASPLELVEDYIRRGGFRPGDRLPSEREFSELLGYSRTAVREAIKRPIYDAVAAGDADGAAGAMEGHLRYFEARLDASFAGWRQLPVPAAE